MPYQFLPSIFTLCNFISGVMSIYATFEHKIGEAIIFIGLGLIFDFLDGWTARKLNVVSDFGKELDSLSDIVTFGIAPAIIAYQLTLVNLGKIGLGIALLYSIGAVLRLARFNTSQSDLPTFVGLPVPAAAICLLICTKINLPIIVMLSSLTLTYLMISNIKFPHFKKMKVDEEEYYGAH